MVHGVNKTDKLHLFDDRNLKSLIRLYNWSGEKKQKEMKRKSEDNEVCSGGRESNGFIFFLVI